MIENLPKVPHNLQCWCDKIERALNAGETPSVELLHRLIDDARWIIRRGSEGSDPYLATIQVGKAT